MIDLIYKVLVFTIIATFLSMLLLAALPLLAITTLLNLFENMGLLPRN